MHHSFDRMIGRVCMPSMVPWLLLMASPVAAQLRGESTQQQQRALEQELQWNDTMALSSETDDEVLVEQLQLSTAFDDLANSSESRRLAEEHTVFKPLECNRGVRCFKGQTTWTNENYKPQSGKVTIPCGWCVIMDYTESDTLELPHGLNIEGTLRFRNGYKLHIKTPFVHVQGNLEMFAYRKVTDEPNIKITFTGTNELITSFVPADSNKFACSPHGATNPSPCFVGRKPFVVAGGKVTIRGLSTDCRTWVYLEDIVRDDELPSPTDYTTLKTNPRCNISPPYIQDNFETTDNVDGWTGGYGALFQVTPSGDFRVTDRKDENEHGPTLDLRRIRDCLVPDQEYLFRARIKLTKSGVETGTPTTCTTSDTNCVTLQSTVRTRDGQIGRRKGWETKEHGRRYGIAQDFYAVVAYDSNELDLTNIYQILQIRGPEPGVDIEMDNVRFSLPPPEAVPDPENVCSSNLILNGDAELDAIHPYPIENLRGGVLSVEQEDGNSYFHLSGRTSNSDSIIYYMDAPGCLVANGKFKVSAKIRIDSDVPIKSRIELRTSFSDGSAVQRTIAECDGSTRSSWTVCEARFTLLEELSGDDLEDIRLQFETLGAPNADMDVDDMKLEIVNGSATSIILPSTGVSNCWGPGAEVMITSHTLNYEDTQVRRIISNPKQHSAGFVQIELDSAIVPPTTRKQSDDFAVEVALLNRNILFAGDTDDRDSLLGAHFIVLHTPNVDQLIEGAEFFNFGQQGVLGKYPIHFHMCGDVQGAVVAKNLIRESKQRCVVVHGSHNVTIVDNVSYDTQGHCYMTEDGGEIDNVFRGNLGALTQAATRLVRPIESDDFPSTFWCSNPQNEWIDNVAAGSRHNGFWFELQSAVREPTADMPLSEGMIPRSLPLKKFQGNVAHSNGMHGLRTYPFGYMPEEEAVFVGTRSFRNKQGGIFFHNSRNLAVSGGVLADNMIQLDFDRGAHDIRIQGTSLIGVTDLYKYVVASQPEAPAHSDMVIGMELHGFTQDMSREGGTIRDVTFSGFSNTQASHTALIEIDDDVSHGHFDYWTTLKGVRIIDNEITPAQFDFSGIMANGVDNVYLTDLDSGMRPRGSFTGVSTVISNTPAMTKFIDMAKCDEFKERSYMYCRDTCLRTVLFAIPPSMTEEFVLRVNKQGDAGDFIEIDGKFDYETINKDGTGGPDEVANAWYRKRRYYAAALPADSKYVFRFRRNNGVEWPTSVEITMEKSQCPGSLEIDQVSLVTPSPSESECKELIRNGDLEMSNSDYPFWLHHDTGLQLLDGEGRGGSNALSEINEKAPANALIEQYIDTRCLQRGKQYEVSAWVKLTRNDLPFACDSVSSCPKARLRLQTRDENGLGSSDLIMHVVDFFERPYSNTGWNRLQGVFTVDARIEAAESVLFFIERGRTGVKMVLDDISVSLVPDQCDELVFNGDFANGKSTYWYKSADSTELSMKGNALEMTRRSSLTHSPVQDIRTGCLVSGQRYLVTARVKLTNADGSLYNCDETYSTGDKACPRMRLRSFVDVGLPSANSMVHEGGSIAVTDHGTSNGWYHMSGVFMANDFDASADISSLTFDQVSSRKDFIVDDVSITHLPKDCSELLLNGNAEYGDTPSFWTHWITEGKEKIDIVSNGAGNQAFKVYNREQLGDGIHQYVDPRCLTSGSRWRLVAQMKLVSRSTGKGVPCDPSDTKILTGCPPVRIIERVSGAEMLEGPFYMSNRPNWSANSYNRYEVEFTVDSAFADSDRVSVAIRSYNLDWDLYLDDITLRPVS